MATKWLAADLQAAQNYLYFRGAFAVQPQWSFVRFLALESLIGVTSMPGVMYTSSLFSLSAEAPQSQMGLKEGVQQKSHVIALKGLLVLEQPHSC